MIRISASQVKTYQRCPRLWGYGKLEGKRTSSAATRFGNLLHAMVEEYLLHGGFSGEHLDEAKKLHEGHEEPNIKKALKLIANAIDKGLLPGKLDGYVVEAKVEGQVWDNDLDTTYLGFLDLTLHGHDHIPTEIVDHKTTSNWKWAQKEETLPFDPQINLYALHTMRKHALSEIKVSHIQYLTKGKIDTAKVSAIITKEGAEEVLEAWREPAKKIKAIYDRGLTLEQLPCKLSGCSQYGGCPHKDICTRASSMGKGKENKWMKAWGGEPTTGTPAPTEGTAKKKDPPAKAPTSGLHPEGWEIRTIHLSRKLGDKKFGSIGIEIDYEGENLQNVEAMSEGILLSMEDFLQRTLDKRRSK